MVGEPGALAGMGGELLLIAFCWGVGFLIIVAAIIVVGVEGDTALGFGVGLRPRAGARSCA